METREARLRAAAAALDTLAAAFAATRPDVAIIFGNDQSEMFLDDIRPAFTIMGCPQFENLPRTGEQAGRLPPGIAIADSGHLPDHGRQVCPGHPALAEHLAASANRQDFDVAWSGRQHRPDPARAQTSGLPHAYGFIYKQVFRDTVPPCVLIDCNTFFPPNQPRAARCHAFGRAIGAAIRDWPRAARICIVASGGLSHFVVDEEFDREIMDAMRRNDFERLLQFDEGWYQAGSSEIKSWIAAGGAMAGAGLDGRIVDYQALYRTPGGTGSSAAFMLWEQAGHDGGNAISQSDPR